MGDTPTGPVEHAPAAALKSSVRVIVRVRPPGPHEVQHIECDDHVGGKVHVEKPAPADHTFGVVLGTKCTQHEVYLSCGVPMIEASMAGRDSLLFAYGQSGAGKTFSMYGADGGKNPSKLDGVVPATVAELFRRTTAIEKDNMGQIKFSLGCTLVEIQGNWIFDLLAEPDKDGNQPPVRLVGSRLVGNRVERIYSSRSLTHTIERGMATRTTASNLMHEHSSRSHCFLQLILERRQVCVWHARTCTPCMYTHVHPADPCDGGLLLLAEPQAKSAGRARVRVRRAEMGGGAVPKDMSEAAVRARRGLERAPHACTHGRIQLTHAWALRVCTRRCSSGWAAT